MSEVRFAILVISRRSYVAMASLLCALLLAGIAVVMLEIVFSSVRSPGSDTSPQTRMRPPGKLRQIGLLRLAESNVVPHAFT